MRIPPGMSLHVDVRVFRAGDDLPPELEALLPEEIRVRAESDAEPFARDALDDPGRHDSAPSDPPSGGRRR